MWVPAETFHHLEEAKGLAEVQRFLWLHSAEIAGFTLIPFLIWHHYFDDIAFGRTRMPGQHSLSDRWRVTVCCRKLLGVLLRQFWSLGTGQSPYGRIRSGVLARRVACLEFLVDYSTSLE